MKGKRITRKEVGNPCLVRGAPAGRYLKIIWWERITQEQARLTGDRGIKKVLKGMHTTEALRKCSKERPFVLNWRSLRKKKWRNPEEKHTRGGESKEYITVHLQPAGAGDRRGQIEFQQKKLSGRGGCLESGGRGGVASSRDRANKKEGPVPYRAILAASGNGAERDPVCVVRARKKRGVV